MKSLNKIVSIRGVVLHTRGIISLIGGCLILLTFAIDFSYGRTITFRAEIRQANIASLS